MQIHRSCDTHYLALQAKDNHTYYWVDHDRKPTESAPTPVPVHNWLQDANRRSPWRAHWLNDSAAAEYRVDVQTVLRPQPNVSIDEPEAIGEPEIADEDALNLTGAEWTRTLRHTGKAGRVLASAISKLKSVSHIKDTTTVLSKIFDVLRVVSDVGGFFFTLMTIVKLMKLLYKTITAWREGRRSRTEIIRTAGQEAVPVIRELPCPNVSNIGQKSDL